MWSWVLLVDRLDFKRQQWVEGRAGPLQETCNINAHDTEHSQVVWGVGTELGVRTGLGDELLWMQSDWGFEYHAEESGLSCIGDWEPLKVDWVLA